MLVAAVVALLCGALWSAPVAVAATPAALPIPTLTIVAVPDHLIAGERATVSARIDVPGASLALSRMRAGEAGFTLLSTLVVGADGSAAWPIQPARTGTYRVEYAESAAWSAVSAETTISVQPRLRLTATEHVYEGRSVTFSAVVSPAHPGATVELQRLVNRVWTPWRTLTLNAESRASYRWTSDERGSFAFRLAMPADTEHSAGASAKQIVTVMHPNPYGVPAGLAHIIVVDKSQYRLYYIEYGRIVRVFDCVLGKPSTPTPVGHYRIYAKDPHMYGPYGPHRMRYMGAYAIHGTNEPWLLTRWPRAYSHGCTRLSNTNIVWLFSRCHVGTPVWNVP
jgi:lipoprotein-anchoring transpeptidase ErfK/SrfK